MTTGKPLRVLLIEDVEDDALLALRALRRAGYAPISERVDREPALREALTRPWDVILSDDSMPYFSGMAALAVVQELGIDIPFLLVSGTIGEENAVLALKAGVHDYLLKGHLARLPAAIERELNDAELRRKRRSAEAALASSEARFRSLIASMEDQVVTLDLDNHITGIYARRLGAHVTERLIGHPLRDAFGESAAEAHEAALAGAPLGESVTYTWFHGQGTRMRHYQTVVSPLRTRQQLIEGRVMVVREVTQQRRAEAQLQSADRMVQLGMLAAGVAHEINNPLAAVVANLDFVREECRRLLASGDPTSPPLQNLLNELDEPLRDAYEAANRVRQIVKDLRGLSRAEVDEQLRPVSVTEVLESALRVANASLRGSGRVHTELETVPLVQADPARLGQVFLNLLVNAAQSVAPEQVDVHEIRVRVRLRGTAWVAVEISDSGSGMPPEVVARLFTPFFTTKPVGVGTGLGLSICHRIISSLGGRIEVESAVGKGTTMRVLLPTNLSRTVEDDPPSTIGSSISN